jgi:hypothetical protein
MPDNGPSSVQVSCDGCFRQVYQQQHTANSGQSLMSLGVGHS